MLDGPGGGGGPPFSTAFDELQPANSTAAIPDATKERTQVRDMHPAFDSILSGGWEKTHGTGAKEIAGVAVSFKMAHKLFFGLTQAAIGQIPETMPACSLSPKRLLVHLQ